MIKAVFCEQFKSLMKKISFLLAGFLADNTCKVPSDFQIIRDIYAGKYLDPEDDLIKRSETFFFLQSER